MDPTRDYIWIQDFTNKHDRHLRAKLKDLVVKDVFGNPDLPAQVAPMLVDLVQQPNIKSLMTDLFIILLRNPAFVQDTDRLVKGLIHDYLASEDCFKLFRELIMTQVLTNYETIIPSLFNLLKSYLMGDDRPFLQEQASGVLINVIQIQGIVDTIDETVHKEFGGALENPEVV